MAGERFGTAQTLRTKIDPTGQAERPSEYRVCSNALMRPDLPQSPALREQVTTHLVMPAYVIPQGRKSASFLLKPDVHCNVQHRPNGKKKVPQLVKAAFHNARFLMLTMQAMLFLR